MADSDMSDLIVDQVAARLCEFLSKALSKQQLALEASIADIVTRVVSESGQSLSSERSHREVVAPNRTFGSQMSRRRGSSQAPSGTSTVSSLSSFVLGCKRTESTREPTSTTSIRVFGSQGTESSHLQLPQSRPSQSSISSSPSMKSSLGNHSGRRKSTVQGLEASIAEALLSQLGPKKTKGSCDSFTRAVVPVENAPAPARSSGTADDMPWDIHAEEEESERDDVCQVSSTRVNLPSAKTLHELRAQQLSTVVEASMEHDPKLRGNFGMHSSPYQLMLRICGVIPWTELDDSPLWQRLATLYQFAVLVVGLLSFLGSVWLIIRSTDAFCDAQQCTQLGLLSDVALCLGGCLGLFVTQYNSRELIEFYKLLRSYAVHRGFEWTWAVCTWWDFAAAMALWLVAVFGRVHGSGVLSATNDDESNAWNALPIIGFSFSSMLLVSLAYGMLCICRGLIGTVDGFCQETVGEEQFEFAVLHWNIVQALLRKASAIIQKCMLVFHFTVLCTLLLGCIDLILTLQAENGKVSSLLPGMLMIVGSSMVFFTAAAVTDKCARVPSLINSCIFEDDMSSERQYIVDYIRNSAAGFYIFEVCLNSKMVCQFTYILVVGSFALSKSLWSSSG